MNLKQAEYIITVLQEGGFNSAAKKLFISQPALSQIIKSVEEEIGAPVFQRYTFPIQLTEAGEKCLEVCRQMLFLDHKLKAELREMSGGKHETFRFGICRREQERLLPLLLSAFQSNTVRDNLYVSTSSSHHMEQMLLNSSLDIALLSLFPAYSALEYLPVLEDHLGILVSKDSRFAKEHPDQDSIDFTEVEGEVFAAKPAGNSTRNNLNLLLKKYHLHTRIALECDLIKPQFILTTWPDYLLLFTIGYYQSSPWAKEHTKFYSIRHEALPYHTYIAYRKGALLTESMQKWIRLVQDYFSSPSVS